MAVLALARAQLALSGTVDAVVLGVVYGLAWLVLATMAGWRPHPAVAFGNADRLGHVGGRARSVGLGRVIGLGAAVGLGAVGGLILVAVSLLARAPGPLITAHAAPFAAWTAVTTLVAVAEEVVLRGAFFDAARRLVGPLGAALVAAVAFALIHVPLDGWSIVPLDVGVGLWLAGLRLLSRGVAAPAAAHVVADLATWWL